MSARMLCCALAVFALPALSQGARSSPGFPGKPILPSKKVLDGITVFAHPARAFDQAPQATLDPTPLTVIGGEQLTSPYDLSYVGSGELLSDGRVALWATIGAHLMIFDREGRPLHAYGGEGKGPKEIMRARNVVQIGGDTILLLDGGNSRIVWATPDAGVLKTLLWKPEAQGRRRWTPDYYSALEMVAGVLPDGRVITCYEGIVSGLPQGAVPEKIIRQTAPLLALDVEHQTVEKLASLTDIEVFVRPHTQLGKTRMETDFVGFGRRAHAVVWDSVIATAEGDGYVIDLRDARGRIIGRISSPRQSAGNGGNARRVCENDARALR